MIGPGRKWDTLRDYPWSSLSLYLASKRHRPAYLRVEDVLARLQWRDTAAGRRKYAEYLEQRAEEEERDREPDGSGSRPGPVNPTKGRWCLGGEAFRERMLDRLERLVDGKKKESFSGAAVRETGERHADHLVERGLRLLELSPSELDGLIRSDPRKQALAWWIRSQTTVSNAWVAERLSMGHPSAVSTAVGRVKRSASGPLRDLKKRLNLARRS